LASAGQPPPAPGSVQEAATGADRTPDRGTAGASGVSHAAAPEAARARTGTRAALVGEAGRRDTGCLEPDGHRRQAGAPVARAARAPLAVGVGVGPATPVLPVDGRRHGRGAGASRRRPVAVLLWGGDAEVPTHSGPGAVGSAGAAGGQPGDWRAEHLCDDAR